MSHGIKVAILDDHQSIIDGYLYRLVDNPDIEVVGTAKYGEELEQILQCQPVDVLLMDVMVPIRPDETSPFPIMHVVRDLLQKYPNLNILVISILTQKILIKALVDAGISGYVFKQDAESISQLGKIVQMVANGGIYFSQEAHNALRSSDQQPSASLLTARQLEILTLCASYPNLSTAELAARLGIAGSTLRNLLSNAYLRLDVRTLAAAIFRLQEMGLFPANPAEL